MHRVKGPLPARELLPAGSMSSIKMQMLLMTTTEANIVSLLMLHSASSDVTTSNKCQQLWAKAGTSKG